MTLGDSFSIFEAQRSSRSKRNSYSSGSHILHLRSTLEPVANFFITGIPGNEPVAVAGEKGPGGYSVVTGPRVSELKCAVIPRSRDKSTTIQGCILSTCFLTASSNILTCSPLASLLLVIFKR